MSELMSRRCRSRSVSLRLALSRIVSLCLPLLLLHSFFNICISSCFLSLSLSPLSLLSSWLLLFLVSLLHYKNVNVLTCYDFEFNSAASATSRAGGGALGTVVEIAILPRQMQSEERQEASIVCVCVCVCGRVGASYLDNTLPLLL